MSAENIEVGIFEKMAKAFSDDKTIVAAMKIFPDFLDQSVKGLKEDVCKVARLAIENIRKTTTSKDKKRALIAFCRFFNIGVKTRPKRSLA